MLLAAVAHKYSFPHEPYHINVPGYGNDRPWTSALTDVFSLADVSQDVTEHLGVLGSSLSRRFRGRTAYHLTPGVSESEHLMSNSTTSQLSTGYQGGASVYNLNSGSDSEGSTATASTTKNRYGAVDGKAMSQSQELGHGYGAANDGIAIAKQSGKSKDYSPQYGVPKILGNYFAQQELPIVHQQQQTSDASTRRSSGSDSRSESIGVESGTSGPVAVMRKSDSMASDWLSTPTDEFMGIDVKGIEKDRINYKGDPRI